jgi:hypothetical protein
MTRDCHTRDPTPLGQGGRRLTPAKKWSQAGVKVTHRGTRFRLYRKNPLPIGTHRLGERVHLPPDWAQSGMSSVKR